MKARWKYKWNKRLNREVFAVAAEIMGAIALEVEKEAKGHLFPFHGYLTGTLERSIHTAGPDYTWANDDIEPSEGTPERGGRFVKATVRGKQVTISVGSGMAYAMAQHQGFRHYISGQFIRGYHYLVRGSEDARGRIPQITKRFQL